MQELRQPDARIVPVQINTACGASLFEEMSVLRQRAPVNIRSEEEDRRKAIRLVDALNRDFSETDQINALQDGGRR